MRVITKNCTGCKACIDRCPQKAIKFSSENLFEEARIDEKKCINCNICLKICPNNNIKEKNNPQIKVSRIKNNSNITKSASGGIFGELARFILKNNGVIYGASYSDDLYKVNHIRCSDIYTLDRILKSKYVRSDINDCFLQAEKDLKANKIVLFSGTPCQIAGLKKYLKKEYDNLYTVDIICHGTPSPIIYERYIKYLEEKEKSKVINIDFRYFNKEEPQKNMLIKFENGKIINEILYNTSYGRAFLVGLINDKCCNECKFNDFRNYSDITLGDAWGYKNKTYPNKNSLIFLNTERGNELYNKIIDELIEFDDFNFKEMVTAGYPIIHSTFSHYNNGKVDINAQDINKELWFWLEERNGLSKDEKGVGILNFHYENYNYGANLVAYSLSKTIEKIGYNPYIIDFDPFDVDPITRYRTLGLYCFRQKHLNMTPKFKDAVELYELNKYLDMFVVGSDQVWRKSITCNNWKTYFLDFAKDKNKISYAASFGKDCFEGNKTENFECFSLLSSFYNISTRENSGKEICKEHFLQDAKVVLDPTLLLSREEYESIIDEEYNEEIDVAAYFVLDYENKILDNDNLKRLFPGKKVINIKGEHVKKPFGEIFIFNSVSKWLDGFRKAKYIVTDSYHGLIFSIIFNKKVILIGKNSASPSRFETLAENLKGGIEKVNYGSLEEVQDIDISLDYSTINRNIKKMQKDSIEFLKVNLGPDKIKLEDEFVKKTNEILSDLSKENMELKSKLSDLEIKYNIIVNSKSWKFTRPIRYIRRKIGDKK